MDQLSHEYIQSGYTAPCEILQSTFRKRMNRLFAGVVSVVLITGTMLGAYLRNVPQVMVQPNGKIVHCLASGDEYHHWLHDSSNYTIVQDLQTGFYVYAVLLNGQLAPSPYVPGEVDPASAGLRTAVNISSYTWSTIRNKSLSGMPTNVRKVQNTGLLNNIVIFVRFSDDVEFGDSLDFYDGLFNSSIPGSISMRAYYEEASYAQLNIQSYFFPPPIGGAVVSFQDSHARAYYRPFNAATNPSGYTSDIDGRWRERNLVLNVLTGVSSQIPADLGLDNDNDGYVDNVCFVVAGSAEGWGAVLWPHMSTVHESGVVINGARVANFDFHLQASLKDNGVGVLCHEMFHSLGAPDLYHYNNDGVEPVFMWDIMAHETNPPQHMGAYMKHRYGRWINSIPQIVTSGTYSLHPLAAANNNAFRIGSPNSMTEYFVLEYRRKTGSFEASLPGEGLLVYRINTGLDGQGNSEGPPDEVYIYRPDGTTMTNGNLSNACYSSNVGRTELNDATNPLSFLSDGQPGGLTIAGIGGADSIITFKVTLPLPASPVLVFPANHQSNPGIVFFFRWSSSPGTLNYLLQVASDSLFKRIVMNDSSLTDTMRSSPQLQLGARYFWRVRVRNSVGNSGFSPAFDFTMLPSAVDTLSASVVFPSYAQSSDYYSKNYRLLGIPGNSGASVTTLLTGVQEKDWRVSWDNGNPRDYIVRYDGSSTFVLSTGRAFWVLNRGTINIALTVPSATLNANEEVEISLHGGWNLITNPFTSHLFWQTVQSANNISEPIYTFTGFYATPYIASYESTLDFNPYVGYYYFNTPNDSVLRIPYAALFDRPAAAPVDPSLWRITISAASSDQLDNAAAFGVAPEAALKRGSLNFHKPRAMSDLVSVSFNRPDLDAQFPDFATDIRPDDNQLYEWQFDLRAQVGRAASLTFSRLDRVPSSLEIWLIDRQNARVADLRRDSIYKVIPATPLCEFSILVGEHSLVTQKLAGVTPTAFWLGQNFPNPFNPSTTIPVAVPENAEVTLKLYNILGREVKTIYAGRLDAGRHWFTWDGTNQEGKIIASGIYLARFQSLKGHALTTKLLLIK